MYTIKYLQDNLKNLNIDYNKELKIPENASCGLEIEFVNAIYKEIEKKVKSLENNWHIYQDSTVWELNSENPQKNKGGEVTSPTITNQINIWEDLKEICEYIKTKNGYANEKTAGHIHIGSQTFKNYKTINNFLIIWAAFEDVINKFLAGEYINPQKNNKLAINCKNEIIKAEFDIEKLITLRAKNEKQTPKKVYGISLYYFTDFTFERYNTIEFRKIRGTLEKEIWQNNLNFLLHLIQYAKNIETKDIQYLKNKYINNNYNQKDLFNSEKAIELADLIYDKEIDKLYFLKQYFKDFNYSEDENKKIKIIKK